MRHSERSAGLARIESRLTEERRALEAAQAFPWSLFRRFVTGQLVLVCLALGIGALSSRWLVNDWLARHLEPNGSRLVIDQAELALALSIFDRVLVVCMVTLACLFALYSAWSGRRIVRPLGRIMLKARRLVAGDALPADDDPLDESDPGDSSDEWQDLEAMLDRLSRNLRQGSETLDREREELDTLMSAISDAILAVDRQGVPLFFNSRFALLFGQRRLVKQASRPDVSEPKPRLTELFRAPELLGAFRASLEGGIPRTVSAELRIGAEAELRYFSVAVAPLRKEGGEPYGAIGVFHDVTELKRAEQIRIEFVGNVSHELRTPLTAIKGYTDTLRTDAASGHTEDLPKFLAVIGRNVDRLMALIGDLLDISSLESAGAEVSTAEIDTRELTLRVLNGLEALRAAKGQWIETAFGAPTLQADPRRAEQVLVNLLENAIKYVPHGGKIQVVWQAGASPGGTRLRVIDSGPGIPPEHQPRLFERFYRVDKARSRELGGTGLGLAIVKHIMQAHGGSVTVTSEQGKGAEFVCEFPGAG